MLWSSKKSVLLSLILCFILAGLLLAGVCAMPALLHYYMRTFSDYARVQPIRAPLLSSFYLLVLPAAGALYWLIRLLLQIRNGSVFTVRNTAYLRRISWCCAAAALILFAGGCALFGLQFYNWAAVFAIISLAAAFLFLVLRVIKNVFSAAVELKDENDMTI